MTDTSIWTLSDQYNYLIGQIDKKQALIQSPETELKAKIFYQTEVEQLQKETKAIQDTMVEHGDLEFLPWIKNQEINPIIKILK